MNGRIEINHAAYRAKVKTMTVEALRFTIEDAKAAMYAMPDGPKAGYYADEIHYCWMELKVRSKI